MTEPASFGQKVRADELVVALVILLADACVIALIYILSALNGYGVLVTTNTLGEFWVEVPFVLAAVPLGAYALWRALVRAVVVEESP